MTKKATLIILFVASVAVVFTCGDTALNINLSGGRYFIQAGASVGSAIAFILGLLVVLGIHRRPKAEMDMSKPVGLFKRFAACLIDLLVYLVLLLPSITFLALLVEGARTGELAWWFSRDHRVPTDIFIEISFAITMISFFVLFALPVSRQRQSLGQLIMGYIVLTEGGSISLFKASLRGLLACFAWILFIISCPMALLRKDKRMWHDLVFNTYPCEKAKDTISGST
jgi:uncharacterized RDD family membrane protein YckC